MFKSFLGTLKNLGKKAIGYVRGLNGNKAASFVSSMIKNYVPLVGDAANPFLQKLGSYVNSKLDEWSEASASAKEGGIRKPMKRWAIKQKDNMKNEVPIGTKELFEQNS